MPTGRNRGWWAVVATLGLALLLAGTPAAHAGVATYTATATVYDYDTIGPVAGAKVALYAADPAEGGAALKTATTNSDGIATFSGVPAGDYWTVVTKAGYHDGTSEGSSTIDEFNSELGAVYLQAVYGKLTGKVLDEDGKEYDCAEVRAYRTGQDASGDLEVTSSGNTGNDGEYSIDLPVGTYKLEVVEYCEDYPPIWIGPAGATYQTATTISVVEAGTTAPTVTLRAGSKITGTVKASDGSAIGDVRVVAVAAGQDPEESEPIASARSDEKGTYTLRRLAAGTYDLRFTDPLGDFQPKVLKNVVVKTDDVSGKDVTLDKVPASTDTNLLKGKITSAAKSVIGGIYVTVVDTASGNTYDGLTRRDGTWSIEVEPGTYKVQFSDDQGDAEGDPRYVTEWYDDAPTYRTAREVKVGTKTVTLNAQLTKLGSISGTISTPGPWDETSFYVELYDEDGDRAGSSDTDSTGRYQLPKVVPGTYFVRVTGYVYSENDGGKELIRQFYAGKFSLAAATPVVVGDGQAVTKRNVTLTRQITNVSVPKVSGTAAKAKTVTATAGKWSIAVDVQHAYQWYRGTSKISGATKSTYQATSADVGKQLKVCVVASHRYDRFDPSVAACSALTKKVAAK